MVPATARQKLTSHPDFRGTAVTTIEVRVARDRPSSLMVSYLVTGAIGEIRLPAAAAASRGEELWRHTCFELFVCSAPGGPYCECNFAPSTQWAIYSFDHYRSGMQSIHDVDGPRIVTRSGADGYELTAEIDFCRLARLHACATWRLGLSAVIEEVSGERSYWALAHAPGKPDFHHASSFALEVPPPQ